MHVCMYTLGLKHFNQDPLPVQTHLTLHVIQRLLLLGQTRAEVGNRLESSVELHVDEVPASTTPRHVRWVILRHSRECVSNSDEAKHTVRKSMMSMYKKHMRMKTERMRVGGDAHCTERHEHDDEAESNVGSAVRGDGRGRNHPKVAELFVLVVRVQHVHAHE